MGKYALIYFEQRAGEFLPIPKWGISGFEIYAYAEIINKPGKRKSESDRSNPPIVEINAEVIILRTGTIAM